MSQAALDAYLDCGEGYPDCPACGDNSYVYDEYSHKLSGGQNVPKRAPAFDKAFLRKDAWRYPSVSFKTLRHAQVLFFCTGAVFLYCFSGSCETFTDSCNWRNMFDISQLPTQKIHACSDLRLVPGLSGRSSLDLATSCKNSETSPLRACIRS